MAEFTHLHNHTEYSLLDGMTTPEELAEIVSTNGQVAAAVTDHGTMASYVRWQKAAKNKGIKPLFGLEAYFVDDVDNDDDDTKRERFHLILIAKNDIGLENLFKINKIAWTDQYYYKPRIDFNTINSHNEGIICLSGCMGSALSQAILDGDSDRAEMVADRFKNIYGADYYVEIQPHNPKELNAGLIDIADSKGIGLVGTLDCHFPSKEYWGTEEVLLVCGQKSSFNAPQNRHATEHFEESLKERDLIKRMDILYPDRRLSFKDLPLYVMSADEALQHFNDAGISRLDILENSMEIAEKCNAEVKLGGLYIPEYAKEAKIKMTSNEYLEDIAFFFLGEMGLGKNQEYVDRLQEELKVITDKNFSDYFLLLWDLVTWAKNNDIAMGPARGSSAGSLLAYVLGITKVDPIRFGLLFFRFLNPERNDFPDIDLDFEDRRRDEVKEYLRQRWGEDRVAGVAAYQTFQPKAAIKSVASAFAIPYKEANAISPLFNDLEEFENNVKKDGSKDTLKEFREKYKEILPTAKQMVGRYKAASAHAAGIVVSSVPLDTICPIEVREEAVTKRKIRVIAYDKDECQDIGLIKLDPLSLKAATVIKDTINIIKERHGIDVEEQSLDIDNPDQKVFDEFTKGNVVGIFQAEGAGYASLISDMNGIHDFNDLVASNALVRPGAFDTQGETYLAVRAGSEAQYDHPILEEILKESYGTYIYEEQVMRIAVELAGFSWAKADRLRKIISKKKDPAEFKAYEKDFIEGAERYISTAKAKKLWGDIEKASTYMFNKSHATAYSWMSYQTMWLKVNYPLEFMWATLYNEDVPEHVTTYVFEAIRLGFEIYGPDVNESDESFKIDGEGLRFGIGNIAGCGKSVVDEVISKRPFASYDQFLQTCKKSKVRINNVEAMEKVGFFESIGHSPYEKERYFGPILNYPINKETKYDAIISTCSEAADNDENFYIIRGLVKSTKRTDRYFRVEIEDSSGTYSGFGNKDDIINKRDYIIAFVGYNSILQFEDFNELETSKSAFAKFLNDECDQIDNPYEALYSKGLDKGINVDKYSLAFYMGLSRYITKTGSAMANLYFMIPGHGILKQTLFGKQLDYYASEINNQLEWKMIKLVTSKRGDSYYLNDMKSVKKFCYERGIII